MSPVFRQSVRRVFRTLGAAWLVAVLSGGTGGFVLGGVIGLLVGMDIGCYLGVLLLPASFALLRRKPHTWVFVWLFVASVPSAGATAALSRSFESTRNTAIATYCGAMLLISLLLRDERRQNVGRCARCEYDLTGNVSGVCPECGTPLDSTIVPRPAPPSTFAPAISSTTAPSSTSGANET